jgi:enamine deaminase RidA (YjgF/YER057c/UK114 family)
MSRRSLNSPTYHVPIQGFSQVIVAPARGQFLFVSGLTARQADGTIVSVGDLEGQARQVLRSMQSILQYAGASLEDVVQIRTYVRDLNGWPSVEKVLREFFTEPWPASTIVQIVRLYDERQLIEMEAVALVTNSEES